MFSCNKSRDIAIQYNLSMTDPTCYMCDYGDYVTYEDVVNIVEQLWLAYFSCDNPKPLHVSQKTEDKIKLKIYLKYYNFVNGEWMS